MKFKDKVVVVTGAGGTLCSEISIDLASKGAKVALVGRTKEKLDLVADKIKTNGGIAEVFVCDVSNEESVKKLANDVKQKLGLCNYLINGAGGNNQKAMPTITQFDKREMSGNLPEGTKGIYNIDMDAFESVLNINTMGTVYPLLEFTKQMIEIGEGSVINFASMNSYCPLTRCFAYAMSKAAVTNLTQSFAAYFAPANIRINAIAPGFMVNERSKNYLGTVEDGLTLRGQSVINHTPMGRFGEAKDLLGCVDWLLDSKASSFVTGITVPVDGGFLTLGGV
ncbi:MAG: SDR family NAD(P)-dependent oxidoreductase [Ruminococcaceae bacterium]|nr:SDR family NAD(P)-dependent oxidoreductase [Oscillospiraceae bacterium]